MNKIFCLLFFWFFFHTVLFAQTAGEDTLQQQAGSRQVDSVTVAGADSAGAVVGDTAAGTSVSQRRPETGQEASSGTAPGDSGEAARREEEAGIPSAETPNGSPPGETLQTPSESPIPAAESRKSTFRNGRDLSPIIRITFWLGGGIIFVGLVLAVILVRRSAKRASAGDDLAAERRHTLSSKEEPARNLPAFRISSETKIIREEQHKVRLKNGSISIEIAQHTGNRPEQQDTYGISDPQQAETHLGVLIALADGLDGHAHGKEASKIAVSKMLSNYAHKRPQEPVLSALQRGIQTANEAVRFLARQKGAQNNVGTTLTAIVIQNGFLNWLAAGDTRLYLSRQGKLTQLTRDHSYFLELLQEVQKGNLKKETVENHPHRNALTSFIGIEELQLLDRNQKAFSLQRDDMLLLCSEGLYGSLSEQEVLTALTQKETKRPAALINTVLRKSNTRQDNMTAIVVAVNWD